MARLFIEGFEHGSIYGFPNWVGYLSITGGITGSYGGRLTYGLDSIYRDLLANKSEIWVSFKYLIYGNSVASLCYFRDSAGTIIASLNRLSTGYIELRRGIHNATLLETSTIAMLEDVVYLIEVWYKPLNDGGRCIVKIDGVEVINFDDVNGDSTAGLENVRYFGIGSTGQSLGNDYPIFDDIVVDDANWIGNSYIQAVKVNAVGDTSAVWTASTGLPWQCVDEVPYNDADYISTNVVANVDTYNCNDLAGTIGSVKALRVLMRYAYEGTPTPTKVKIAIRSGGNYFYGNDLSPALTYQFAEKFWGLNPDDSQPWEDADIDDLEIGVASVA
jgi:hypothetical protein